MAAEAAQRLEEESSLEAAEMEVDRETDPEDEEEDDIHLEVES